MIKKYIPILITLLIIPLVSSAYYFDFFKPKEPVDLGVAPLTFISSQVGVSPVADYILQTDGTSSSWVDSSTFASMFAWDKTTDGVSTSTQLEFLSGFISSASSTIDADLTITGNSTTTNATTTDFYASTLGLNSEYFTDLTGAGLSNVSKALTLDMTSINSWTGLQTFANASTTGIHTVNELCFTSDGCITSPVSQGSGIELFPNNTATDIATYETLRTVPDTSAQVDESCSATSGYCATVIDNYVSTTTLSATGSLVLNKIPAGVWKFQTYTYVSNIGGTNVLEYTMLRRTSLGVETDLFQATSTDINFASVNRVQTNTTQLAFAFDPTDRLVLRIKGWTDSGAARVIHWVYGGTSHYSHVETPITIASEAIAFLPADNLFTGMNTFSGGTILGNSTTTNATTTGTSYSNIATSTSLFASAFNFGSSILSLVSKTITAGVGAIIDFGGASSFELPNGAGGTTVDATGEVTVDSILQSVNFHSGTAERVLSPRWHDGWVIENATTTDGTLQIALFVEDAVTVDKVVATYRCEAPCTSGMTLNFEHNTTLVGAGNDLFTADINANSSTTPESFTTGFSDATVPAGSYLWLEPTSASTTQMTLLDIMLYGYIDP